MIDHLRPVGALLAGLAAWSVALLLLAVAGLGGRVGPHPANAALAPPVPEVSLDVIDSRLGPASDFLEVGNRPLLAADRRPSPMSAGSGNEDAPLDATLTSVLIAGNVRMALLQSQRDGRSQRVRLGEVLEGTAWRLVELEPRKAIFEGPEGRRELDLRVFDGSGGAAPTPIALPGQGEAGSTRPSESPPSSPQGVATPSPEADAKVVAEVTPEQQVEAIRRRIEARRAMRAAEAGDDRTAPERPKQVE